MCKMIGAGLAMVSLVEFVWYATTSSSEEIVENTMLSEDMMDQPMPVDLMAALIQMMTFVSCSTVLDCRSCLKCRLIDHVLFKC